LQVINDLFAIGKLNLTIGKSTQFESRAELGIGNNIGNIKLDGNLNFNFGKGILLSSHLKILRYDPSLIHEDLSLSFTPVINQDFDKINEFSIGGKLLLKKLNLELEFNSGLIDNGIFYDNSAFPVQAESNSEYVQIIAVHKLKWRFIGFQNSILSQEFTDNLFRLPSLYSIHNLFLEKSLFNDNLLARVGVLYYNIELDGGLDFLPITGSFYQSDSQDLKYPYTEIYANFRIDNFRVFIKAENIFDGVNSEEHFLINNYPQRDFDLRIGVRWVIRG